MCTCEEIIFHFPDGRSEPQRRYSFCQNSRNEETCGVVSFLKPVHREVPGAPAAPAAISPPMSPVPQEQRGHRVSLVEPKSPTTISEAPMSSSAPSKKSKRRSTEHRTVLVKEPALEFQLPSFSWMRKKEKQNKDRKPAVKPTPESDVVIHHHHHHEWEPYPLPEAPEPPSAADPSGGSPSPRVYHRPSRFGSPVLPPSPYSMSSAYGSSVPGSDIQGTYYPQPVYQERIPPNRRFSQPEPLNLGQPNLRASASGTTESSSRPASRTATGNTVRPNSEADATAPGNQRSQPVDIPKSKQRGESQSVAQAEPDEEAYRRQQDRRIAYLEGQLREAQNQLERLRFGEPDVRSEQSRRNSISMPAAPASQSSVERSRQTELNTARNSRPSSQPFHRRPSQRATASENTARYSRSQDRREHRSRRHGNPSFTPILHHSSAQPSHRTLPDPLPDRMPPNRASSGQPTAHHEGGVTTIRDTRRAQEVQNRIARLEADILSLQRDRTDSTRRGPERQHQPSEGQPQGNRAAPWDRRPPSPPLSNSVRGGSSGVTSFESSPQPRPRETAYGQGLRHSRGASDDLRGMFQRADASGHGGGRWDAEDDEQDGGDESELSPGPWERQRRRY